MKRTYQLIKLKTEKVEKLKRLRSQMGTKSLDDLIMRMIKFTGAHPTGLRDLGWDHNSTG